MLRVTALSVLGAIFGLLLCIGFFPFSYVRGLSMLPALNNDDLILLDRLSYHFTRVKSGDIVVFVAPEEREKVIKRVALLPGDAIEIDEGYLKVGEERIFLDTAAQRWLKRYKYIPQGYYFLLGDNLKSSLDSRSIGFVHHRQLYARVLLS